MRFTRSKLAEIVTERFDEAIALAEKKLEDAESYHPDKAWGLYERSVKAWLVVAEGSLRSKRTTDGDTFPTLATTPSDWKIDSLRRKVDALCAVKRHSLRRLDALALDEDGTVNLTLAQLDRLTNLEAL